MRLPRPSRQRRARSPRGSDLRTLFDALPEHLARHAFSHSSWVARPEQSYERLAFLGDSVLSIAVSHALFPRFPDSTAGELTKIRAQTVSRRSCVEVARALGVPDRMRSVAPPTFEHQVERLTSADGGRAHRQLGIVDREGRAATYTGEECHAWAGGRTGECYAAQGNILVSGATVDALAADPGLGAACPKILFAGRFRDIELRSATYQRGFGDRRDLGVFVSGARVDGTEVWSRVQLVDGTWGLEPDAATGAIITPIYQTSTYVQDELGRHKGYEYARTQNPTRMALERNIAAMEDGPAAFAFASGMAAISSALLLFSPGDHLVVCEDVYGGTYRVLTSLFARLGITCTFVDAG